MSSQETAQQIVFAAIDEVNDMLPANQQIPKDLDTVLYGNNAVIPSLMLMNLVVAVEEAAEDDHDAEISISKVFHTVNDLVTQVKESLEEGE